MEPVRSGVYELYHKLLVILLWGGGGGEGEDEFEIKSIILKLGLAVTQHIAFSSLVIYCLACLVQFTKILFSYK